MESFFNTAFYIAAFLSVYVQIFLLVTFLENRKKVLKRKESVTISNYPSVAIVVPCWNEVGTIEKTVESLLALQYPKDKLEIVLVNDGSTDDTGKIVDKIAAANPNVRAIHKENGGKHTALNLGLESTNSEFFGCLDADSFVHPDSLSRIINYFEQDPTSMAVAPSIVVHWPKTIIQRAQTVEYYMAVYIKKVLGFLGGMYVTPGPLTIFRKEVFDKIGQYKSAHNTEDMEIAFRMQKHQFKIDQCHDAYVYTNAPRTVLSLYKQRLRWMYGFLNNTIDYKDLIFQKKYGNLALFTLPAALISIFLVLLIFYRLIYYMGSWVSDQIVKYQVVGFDWSFSWPNFDLFFLSTNSIMFIIILLYAFLAFTIFLGFKMTIQKKFFPLDLVYFFVIYSVVAPVWLLRAIYNTTRNKRPAWR